MTQTTDQDLYEQWREDYALTYEPNYDEHLDAYCKAAFLAGMKAARRAQVVAQVEVTDCMALAFHNALTDGPIGEDDFNDIKTGLRAALSAAPQPPEVAQLDDINVADMAQAVDSKEAAHVPKFNHAAKRKLELLQGDGATITGYAIEKDRRRGAIDCHGFVYWWQDGAQATRPARH